MVAYDGLAMISALPRCIATRGARAAPPLLTLPRPDEVALRGGGAVAEAEAVQPEVRQRPESIQATQEPTPVTADISRLDRTREA